MEYSSIHNVVKIQVTWLVPHKLQKTKNWLRKIFGMNFTKGYNNVPWAHSQVGGNEAFVESR